MTPSLSKLRFWKSRAKLKGSDSSLSQEEAQKAGADRSQRGSFDDSVRPLHRLGEDPTSPTCTQAAGAVQCGLGREDSAEPAAFGDFVPAAALDGAMPSIRVVSRGGLEERVRGGRPALFNTPVLEALRGLDQQAGPRW